MKVRTAARNELEAGAKIKSLLLALLVTFLWSTSFVIIKFGLSEISPLNFAGLRYIIAFICLLPFVFTRKNISELIAVEKNDWKKLILLGILFYSITQGAQYAGLFYLPAVTVSLILNFTPVVVAVLAVFTIKENPSRLQWCGVFLFVIGTIFYFYPVNLPDNSVIGIVIMLIGVLANALSSILGRNINYQKKISPYIVTVVSMGIGSLILIMSGIMIEGFPVVNLKSLLFLLWLAVINTALAFTIWNYTLRTLTAMESSIINGTMLIQIAVLAYLFLGEPVSFKEIIGMILAAAGALIVQLRLKTKFS